MKTCDSVEVQLRKSWTSAPGRARGHLRAQELLFRRTRPLNQLARWLEGVVGQSVVWRGGSYCLLQASDSRHPARIQAFHRLRRHFWKLKHDLIFHSVYELDGLKPYNRIKGLNIICCFGTLPKNALTPLLMISAVWHWLRVEVVGYCSGLF